MPYIVGSSDRSLRYDTAEWPNQLRLWFEEAMRSSLTIYLWNE